MKHKLQTAAAPTTAAVAPWGAAEAEGPLCAMAAVVTLKLAAPPLPLEWQMMLHPCCSRWKGEQGCGGPCPLQRALGVLAIAAVLQAVASALMGAVLRRLHDSLCKAPELCISLTHAMPGLPPSGCCSLSVRLSGLENKLAHLDAGSRAVLVQSAGSWLGALQEGSGGGQDEAVGGVDGVGIEEEEVVIVEEVEVAVESTGQSGSGGSGGGA